MTIALVAAGALVLGAAGAYFVYGSVMAKRVDTAQARATKLMADAELEAETAELLPLPLP